ncbi:pyridoxine 5'-phosphate synthase [Roseisolibacter sp. H3M3-2]|uniref:pyridoxine 5'-phosphate synthase n=1 Tax=Roseisolibacter sp. H3M3-2 TaxID=3031323 RepID=UPI0023DAF609|nr:pyridoxine 5'-phosphate synthase [Roseisolibacter sp. H3M3-2]MDF1505566.1 pyridoxine 5'-phosphate synthase [Roseisolibacter sp. H3M3-2]
MPDAHLPADGTPADAVPRPRAARQRLYVNIDHVATVRQARRGAEPDPVEAALRCEAAGADGITAHLREDRRHVQDADVEGIARRIGTVLNLEMACTAEMLGIALRLAPHQVTLVPERRAEITTEGGLNLAADPDGLERAVAEMKRAGIRVSLFIDPDAQAVRRSAELGADAVELHTGTYAHHPSDPAPLAALDRASALAARLGLAAHAGHGLTVANVGPVAAIPEQEELNIGHSIVSRALFVGLEAAVREIRAAMDAARR